MTEFRRKLLNYSKTLENKNQAFRVFYDARAGNGAVYSGASKLRIICNNKAEAIITLVDWMVENQSKYKYDSDSESDSDSDDNSTTFDKFVEFDGGVWSSKDSNPEKIIAKYFNWQSEIYIYPEEDPIEIRFSE